MEHFDHTNGKSLGGSILTIFLGFLAHITKEDILVYVSILAGLVTIGYTVDKWIQSHINKEK